MLKADKTIENLLDLDNVRFVIDERLGLWVKFEAKKVDKTKERPHGIRYSLTLHDRFNNRILGFDNAHAVDNTRNFDHWHRDNTDEGRAYHYTSAETLLVDFWKAVEKTINQLYENLK